MLWKNQVKIIPKTQILYHPELSPHFAHTRAGDQLGCLGGAEASIQGVAFKYY